MTEENLPGSAALATVAEPEGTSETTRASIGSELRRLGQLLSASLRAAASTNEAAELKAELKEGMEALRREMDNAMESTKSATARVKIEGAPTSEKLRSELADALRAVNRALDRMAQSVEPGNGSSNDTEE